MTRTLVIVRHAEAQRSHPDGDVARELAPRGVSDACLLGRWLAQEGLVPDLVLSSPATRARQTTEHALAGAGVPDAEVWGGRGLYDGGVDGVLVAVREVPEGTGTLWVVGHEPTTTSVTTALADRESSLRPVLARLPDGFPTASGAVLTTGVAWDELRPGLATLVGFHTARG